MPIKVLDSATAMKIAAGEVIERPASVVRELLDNALDAQATWISIDVEKGGREYLSVQDNGIGMDAQDLDKCYLNHATSKITQFSDLMSLTSFGFRGEALASLAEIANLQIASKPSSQEFGSELTVCFGEKKQMIPKGMNQGTSIAITEFFQNVPARLKFLNSDVSEYRAIVQEVLKKALVKPEIAFELSHNGEKKYQFNSVPELFQRIIDIFPELSSILHPFIYEEQGIQVYGFLSEPSWYKSTRNYLYLFVNDRIIEWQSFKQQVALAYQQILPPGKFPAVFCYIQANPENIDFNVHPQKKEIRFEDEALVASVVRRALKQGLANQHPSSISSSTNFVSANIHHESSLSKNYNNSAYTKNTTTFQLPSEYSTKYKSPNPTTLLKNTPSMDQLQVLFKKQETSMPDLLSARYIGTMFQTYLLFEQYENLFLIDFHAMHERIRYEHLLSLYQKDVPSQHIIPFVFEVSKSEIDIFEQIESSLNKLGFKLHLIGENSFSVESIPSILSIGKAEIVLRELFLEELSIHDSYYWDMICKTIACKGSSRSGDHLNLEEIQTLLYDWLQCEHPHSCPHGRPIMIPMDKNFFDKEFKRTGF